MLAELLSLAGALTVTSLCINWWQPASTWLAPYLWVDQKLATFITFIGLALVGLFLVHIGIRKLAEVMKWERLHWGVQGLGMLVGALRGLWWVGFLCVMLAGSGFDYLRRSVEAESILGPRVLELAAEHLDRVADLYPGAGYQGASLVPPVR